MLLSLMTDRLENVLQVAGYATIGLASISFIVLVLAVWLLSPPKTVGVYYIRNLFAAFAIILAYTLAFGVLGAIKYTGPLWICIYAFKVPALLYLFLTTTSCIWYFSKEALLYYWDNFKKGR